MGFWDLLGFNSKESIAKKLSIDLKPIFESTPLTELVLGDLNLPTGKIIAGDPFYIRDEKPFKIKVSPGRYPVSILIHAVEEDHHRVAFARIKFSDSAASSWTLALTEDITDEQVKQLKKGEFFGYGVDAGLGCFADAETNEMFNDVMAKFYKENPDKNYYDDVLAEEFKVTSGSHYLSRDEGDWNNHFPKKGDDRNVIMFASGWGDGSYPTYWGYNAEGEMVELITDFYVIDGDEDE